MAKPVLSGVFRAIALLNACYYIDPPKEEGYTNGWKQGRKELAKEIMKELGVLD